MTAGTEVRNRLEGLEQPVSLVYGSTELTDVRSQSSAANRHFDLKIQEVFPEVGREPDSCWWCSGINPPPPRTNR